MRYALLLSALVMTTLASTAAAPQASAEDQTAVTCKDIVIPITGINDSTALSFTLTADNILQQCTSATGAPLTLTSPKDGVTLSPTPNTSKTIPFTVSDDKGNTASANIIVSRD